MSDANEMARRAPGAELAFTVILLVGIASLLLQATALSILAPDGTIGSGFFPLALAILVLLALAAHAGGLLRMGIRDGWQSSGVAPLVSVDQALMVGLIILAIVLGDLTGILAAVGLVMLVGFLLIDRVRPLRAILVTFGTLVVIVIVFGVWLRMDLGLPFRF